jgi:hypothetical protein
VILIRRHKGHVFPETGFRSHEAASIGGEDDPERLTHLPGTLFINH